MPEEPADWRLEAACATVDPETFYRGSMLDVIDARETCRRCPVRRPCLEAGLREPEGVWGGWTSTERDRLKEALRTSPRAARNLILDRAALAGPEILSMND